LYGVDVIGGSANLGELGSLGFLPISSAFVKSRKLFGAPPVIYYIPIDLKSFGSYLPVPGVSIIKH
jgi:hypothetical protein